MHKKLPRTAKEPPDSMESQTQATRIIGSESNSMEYQRNTSGPQTNFFCSQLCIAQTRWRSLWNAFKQAYYPQHSIPTATIGSPSPMSPSSTLSSIFSPSSSSQDSGSSCRIASSFLSCVSPTISLLIPAALTSLSSLGLVLQKISEPTLADPNPLQTCSPNPSAVPNSTKSSVPSRQNGLPLSPSSRFLEACFFPYR